MSERYIQFEWDYEKEKINILKHKVNFNDACHLFSDAFQLNLFDAKHSDDKDRWIVIGETFSRKILVVIHTLRSGPLNDDLRIRIISARKATK